MLTMPLSPVQNQQPLDMLFGKFGPSPLKLASDTLGRIGCCICCVNWMKQPGPKPSSFSRERGIFGTISSTTTERPLLLTQ